MLPVPKGCCRCDLDQKANHFAAEFVVLPIIEIKNPTLDSHKE